MADKNKTRWRSKKTGAGRPAAEFRGRTSWSRPAKGPQVSQDLAKRSRVARAAAKKLMPVEFMLAGMRNLKNPLPMWLSSPLGGTLCQPEAVER
jgi:hypothetical protein